ncbi:DnaT-like ssDNA-binding protein [Vibrio casei]|uniref:DnaT-like ssDNA-binding protein n=1 Tax=Vibrio casei TaxID=673372 RepID=UPI003F9E7B27
MSFIVEDNSGLENANAYISVEFLQSYASSIGVDLSAQSDTELEQLITDVTYNFIDTKYAPCDAPLNPDQALQWPTQSQLINDKFRRAVAEACVLNSQDALFIVQDANGKVKRTKDKLDVLETEVEYQDYAGQSQSSFVKTPSVDKLMSSFDCNGGAGSMGAVTFQRWA